MSTNDESPLLPSGGPEGRFGGGGAGLVLYGALDTPLQTADIEQCAACINDAVNFRSRWKPCPVQFLWHNNFRNSAFWAVAYSAAVVLIMCRCTRYELQGVASDLALLAVDGAALLVVACDIALKGALFGMQSVMLDSTVTALCLADSVYMFHAQVFSYVTVIRIYYVITYSDATLNACRNSVLCLQKVATAISIQALSWFFFSCLCVVLFGLEDSQFFDLPHAMVNMFALMTTSNNPDVWVKLYALNRNNVILFLIYLFVSVFFLQNYVAVTIFSEFSALTNASLYLRRQHRHRSLRMAFDILDSRRRNAIDPPVVYAVLKHIRPHYSKAKIQVLYECIDPSNDFRAVNFEKFCRIVDALGIRVSTVYPAAKAGWTLQSLSPTSLVYRFVFSFVPILNLVFVSYVCMAGKHAIVSHLAWMSMSSILYLTLLSILLMLLDISVHGLKDSLKHLWIYVTVVEVALSAFGLVWAIIVFNTDPPPSSLDHLDAKAVGDFVLSSGLVRALVVALCGRCVAILHVVRALPHFRKIVYSSYAVMPGLLPMAVPLFAVAHVFAFIGMFFFSGLLHADVNFGDGKGRDPYYGLLDFSSYTNSLIIVVNLLVVNNWVKMGSGLSDATGSLWIYIYFIAFFVIGVTFCLLSLTSIFISSIMMDHEINPITKRAASSGGASPTYFMAANEAMEQTKDELSVCQASSNFKVSLRHQDADQLFRIIDSISAPDFQGIMELLSSLMGGCIIVLRGRSKILFENATALTLLNSYTEGATENLFDDMIKDVAESTSKTKVQNKIESRVSDVISRNSTQHDEPKIVHLLSGPIILGIMKYNKLCKTGNISPPDSDRVRRTLQVRYCCKDDSPMLDICKLHSKSPDRIITVFIMKEISQATI